MSIRWIISPVVDVHESWTDETTGLVVVSQETFKAPYLRTLIDPSTGKGYRHSSAITAEGNWALSFVRSDDFTAISQDPLCIDVLEAEYEDMDLMLAMTPASVGWNNAKLNRARNMISQRGGDATGLTETSPLWEWLQRLGRLAMPGFTPRGTWVR